MSWGRDHGRAFSAGGVAADALEPGAAVSLHLPPDALRVLTASEPTEETDEDPEGLTAPATSGQSPD